MTTPMAGMAAAKRLMMLGAGPAQLPAIRRAAEAGVYLITVDYLPDNVGHRYSHQYMNCSTTDREAVLAAARRLAIDGIVTFASDVATPTVAYVAEQLGLPGGNPRAASVMSNKGLFRAFQRQQGLRGPAFAVGSDPAGLRRGLEGLRLPAIVKPVDTSGSRGISRLEDPSDAALERAFAIARQHSRCGQVCVEEYVGGTDVSGDGFFTAGRLSAVVTRKYSRGFMPTGHRLPSPLPPAAQRRIREEVERSALALGYRDGPVDFDARIDGADVVVLEMSPRLGGNGIPMLIGFSTGCDLIQALVRFALGEAPGVPAELACVRGCGSWVFGYDGAGVFLGGSGAEAVRDAVPEVFEYVLTASAGDRVDRFEHSGRSLGYALFACASDEEYERTVRRIAAAQALSVGPVDG